MASKVSQGIPSILDDKQLTDLCTYAAKGQVQQIDRLMKRVLSTIGKVGAFTFSPPGKASPLITAALHGQLKVVKYFLTQYPKAVSVDSTATVSLPRCSFQSGTVNRHTCTALFAASAKGHLNVVKLLTKASASVNKAECCGTTPLHAVIMYGRSFKLLHYLVCHKADVNAVDALGQTPLMVAAKRGDYMLEAVTYLLKEGADPNHLDFRHFSALHHAACHCNTLVVRTLLKYGANPMFRTAPTSQEEQDEYIPCPLYLAAAHGANDVAQELLKHQDCTPACKAEAYLLLGSSQCERSRRWLLHYVEDIWSQALTTYEQNHFCPVYLPPTEAYGKRKEVKSVAELQRLCNAPLSLHEAYYQSLIMRERCMGYGDWKLTWQLIHRGKVFLGQHKYQDAEQLLFRAVEMTIHVLSTKLLLHSNYKPAFFYQEAQPPSVAECLTHLNEWMQRLVTNDIVPSYYRYLELGLGLLEVALQPTYDKELTHDTGELICGIFSLFAVCLSSSEITSLLSEESPTQFEEMGEKFVAKHMFTLPDLTLLHLALSEYYLLRRKKRNEHLVNTFYLVAALLRWGSDTTINYPTSYGQRPLHLAVYLAQHEGHLLVPLLLDHGAHFDAVNADGKTAYDLCANSELLEVLFPSSPLPLVCQACRVLVQECIPYQNFDLPTHIKYIISLHDKHAAVCALQQ